MPKPIPTQAAEPEGLRSDDDRALVGVEDPV
jgi:hypothetical protein